MSNAALSPAPRLTSVQWLICVIAAIGFAFDIYELLMLPLIMRPALLELVGAAPGTPEFQKWVGIMFYVPAFVGGLVGLFGGWLTDRLGRRFVLTWSILLYAVSAYLAGFSTNIWMLLFFRCTTFVGVCVEFVAAVAWLAELFPDPKQRERVLGYTQAFSSIGGLLVAVMNGIAVQYAAHFPAIGVLGFLQPIWGTIAEANQHQAWRYTLMSGLIPAIPLLLIRPFLPESPAWAAKRAAGSLKRPSVAQLFSPQLRRTTIVTTLMFACSYGAAFGAIQQLPQIVPGLADVEARVDAAITEKGVKKDSPDGKKIKGTLEQKVAAEYTKVQEIGGLLGRFTLALLALYIASRRQLLRVFQGPGLILVPLVFAGFLTVPNYEFFTINLEAIYLGHLPITTMSLGVALAGFFTVAQFSFWGNYLPLVYPLHLRGTGESFAANIGGRLMGTSFAAVTAFIVTQLPEAFGTAPMKYALTSAGVAAFVYLGGNLLCFWLPEPKSNELEG